ncbi:MAG: TolC family outer membrane protein, partial [Burkholderiaceae bacterium]
GRERQVQGRAGLLPQAGFNAQVSKVTGDSTNFFLRPAQQSPVDYTDQKYVLQLKQPLYNLGSFIAYDQSKLQVATGEVQFEQSRIDLALRVAQAYFDMLASQDAIAFIQAQKIAIAEQLASAKRNFEVGTATITDTHEAQARFDLTEAQEIGALNDLEVKRNQLALLTGHTPEVLRGLAAGVKLSPPVPATVEQWVVNAESGTVGVVAKGLAAEIAKLDIRRASAGHLPTLDAVASYTDSKSQFINQPVNSTISSIGIQLNIPIFSGYATSSQVTQAIALEEKARADLDTARRNAAQGARTAYLGVQSGLSQVRALEAAERSSLLALDANKLGYEVGVRINIDVLNAQQQLYSTRRDLAKARYDTLVAGLKLKAASGALSEADLAEINALLDMH